MEEGSSSDTVRNSQGRGWPTRRIYFHQLGREAEMTNTNDMVKAAIEMIYIERKSAEFAANAGTSSETKEELEKRKNDFSKHFYREQALRDLLVNVGYTDNQINEMVAERKA